MVKVVAPSAGTGFEENDSAIVGGASTDSVAELLDEPEPDHCAELSPPAVLV
jgi:hypothetical protein